MNNPYTILTIGPIYETLLMADKTRALWGASNLFSGLMNKLLQNLNIDYDKIIVPYLDPNEGKEFLNTPYKAGLLDDKVIIKGRYAKELQDAFDDAKEEIIDYILDALENHERDDYTHKNKAVDKAKAEQYFNEYFHCYIIEVDVPKDKNPVFYTTSFKDSAEYQTAFGEHLGENYIIDYFDKVNRNALKKDIFLPEEVYNIKKDRRFKSTLEISAYELIKNWNDEEKKKQFFYDIDNYDNIDETEVIKELQNDFKDEFKPYHKYYAIIQSDGDGFGKYLESIGNDESRLKALSNNLFDYLIEAVKYIREQGGMVIYAGGDDLLFFAPVFNGEISVFDMISELDEIFKKHLNDSKDSDYEKLSISYGMSIIYYKFPLYEALESAKEQLFAKAKQSKWHNNKEKNALAVSIRKHSSHPREFILDKSSEVYKTYLALMLQEMKQEDEKKTLAHRFHYKLINFELEIDEMEKGKELYNFFKNQFDYKDETDTSLQKVLSILENIQFKKESLEKSSEHLPTKVVFNLISAIKLLKGDE